VEGNRKDLSAMRYKNREKHSRWRTSAVSVLQILLSLT